MAKRYFDISLASSLASSESTLEEKMEGIGRSVSSTSCIGESGSVSEEGDCSFGNRKEIDNSATLYDHGFR